MNIRQEGGCLINSKATSTILKLRLNINAKDAKKHTKERYLRPGVDRC